MRAPTVRPSSVRRGRWTALAGLLVVGALVISACGSSSADAQPEATGTPGAGQATSVGSDGQTQVTAPGLTDTGTDGTSSSPSSPGDAGNGTESTTSSSDPTADMRVTVTPSFGSTDVSPHQEITVIAIHASIANITMLGSDGAAIEGEMTEGDRSWTSTGQMKYGVTYTISGDMKAIGGDATKPFDGTITTADPDDTMAAYVQIPNGATVGIAAPIVVTFAGVVTDRAAAEKQLHVSVTDQSGNPLDVVGSWGWMGDEDIHGKGKQSRVHYRPKEFWPAHAQVHVEANLYGVDYGNGKWGRENIVRDFTIGPKLIVKANADSHRLVVVKNDQVIKNYPVSYGVAAAGFATNSGIHIVQEKKPGAFTMCNKPFYCGVTEYWGVRINNNGEFVHVNKQVAKEGKLGKVNVSHGCINMNMADGEEFFHLVYYGVPVIVTNAGPAMSWQDYVYDWAPMFMEGQSYDDGKKTGSWANWTTLSAL